MTKKDTEAAFCWIVTILQKHNIPFQIGGGFAARLYGAERDLADIDIALPEDRFNDLFFDVKDYVTYGPTHYMDQEWDLMLMTLSYKGQEIDIAGANNKKYFDKQMQQWIAFPTDFSSSNLMEVYGLQVPMMSKEKLIAYKTVLGREVDLIDVKALKAKA